MSERLFPPGEPPRIVLVMGVAGSGKSAVGAALARRLGWDFVDGDAFHSPESIARMRAGSALDDSARAPWLAAIAAWIDARLKAGAPGVIACSALKRAHREALASDRDGVRLVHLEGSEALIARRLGGRRGHFMPASLLASQLAALEPPGPGERAVIVGIEASAEDVAATIARRLGLPSRRAGPERR